MSVDPPGFSPLYFDYNVLGYLSKLFSNVFSIRRISKKFLMETVRRFEMNESPPSETNK